MRLILAAFFLLLLSSLMAQNAIIPLWDDIPNRIETDEMELREENDLLWITRIQKPTLEVYLPVKRNRTGQAVIICPGGGYYGLAYDWEGTDIAKWLNSKGITGIVLKYRVPMSESVKNKHEVPLQDAQRAMRLARSNAKIWGIDPNNIGIMGFSAGGHLASTLGTKYDYIIAEYDQLDSISARPNFMVLVYPVITMKTQTHGGSKKALLGDSPSDSMVDLFSNELHVTEQTPPTFLIHAGDDDAVPVENSLLFYSALKEKNISAELHIYPSGGHGFSLSLENPHLNGWTELLMEWIVGLK